MNWRAGRSRVRAHFERLRSDVRSMGRRGYFCYLLDRTLRRCSRGKVRFRALYFYGQPVAQAPMLAPPAHGAKIRVGLVDIGDLDPRLFERPAGVVAERFGSGSLCLAAQTADALCGYLWLHRGPLREQMFACDFEALPYDRAWWDYDLEIMPDYRLGRTFARLWDEAFRLLREKGVETTVSWIHLWNRASSSAHERMGARKLGWLLFLDFSGYKLGVQSMSPYLRLAPRSRRLAVKIVME